RCEPAEAATGDREAAGDGAFDEALRALFERVVHDVGAALAVVARDVAVRVTLHVEVGRRPTRLLLEILELLRRHARRRNRLPVGTDLRVARARDVHALALGR